MVSQINLNQVENLSNSKGIKFHWAQSVNENITVNNITISSAGQTAANNFGANFGGFKRLITIDFALKDDGTDKSTSADSIVTLKDQWKFFMDTVLQGTGGTDKQFQVRYKLTVFRGETPDASDEFTGVLEDVTIRGDPASGGTILRGTLTLQQVAA